jgi:hypothetical protein
VSEGGEVINSIGLSALERLEKTGFIGDVARKVKDRYLVAALFKMSAQVATNESIASGNERAHARKPT